MIELERQFHVPAARFAKISTLARRVNHRARLAHPALEGATPHVIIAHACPGSQLLLWTKILTTAQFARARCG
jgi:hypothetical protein